MSIAWLLLWFFCALLLLPSAVTLGWPAVLWWIVLFLSRSARTWAATGLALLIGMQIGVLTNRLLGIDVLLFGGSVAFLELWEDIVFGWRRRVGEVVFGSIFCAAFLLAGNVFAWRLWVLQICLLTGAAVAESIAKVWRRRK